MMDYETRCKKEAYQLATTHSSHARIAEAVNTLEFKENEIKFGKYSRDDFFSISRKCLIFINIKGLLLLLLFLGRGSGGCSRGSALPTIPSFGINTPNIYSHKLRS